MASLSEISPEVQAACIIAAAEMECLAHAPVHFSVTNPEADKAVAERAIRILTEYEKALAARNGSGNPPIQPAEQRVQ